MYSILTVLDHVCCGKNKEALNLDFHLCQVSAFCFFFISVRLTLFTSLSLLGKNCELCISGFFRPEETDPTSHEVCQPCDCHSAGTINGSMECAQVHTNKENNFFMSSSDDLNVFNSVSLFAHLPVSSSVFFSPLGWRSVSM